MKWFYVIAVCVVALLAASPYFLLGGGEVGGTDGKVVGYNVYGSKVKSIDPASCGDTTSAGIQGAIYEGLYCYHYLKRPIEVIPQLADGMPEISPDGLTYTVRIKKGVKYSRNACFGTTPDGTFKTRTVRADDFVLAFKRIADFHLTTALSLAFVQDKIVGMKEYRDRTRIYHKGDFSRYDKEQLPGVAAVDEHTLRFKLTRPFPQLLYVLAMHVYAPIPREVIDYHLVGANEPIAIKWREPEIIRREAVVGTGPYLLSEWVKAHKIVLTRNPDFRDEYYPAEGGPGDQEAGLLADAGKKVPFVDQWRLTFVQETNPAWMMFDKKLRDSAGIPRDVFTQVVSPKKELMDEWRKRGIRLVKGTYPAIYWLVFNMEDEVLGSSKSLRQALWLSFNVEEYIELIYNGRATRAVNVLPSTFKGYAEVGPSPYARFDPDAARAKIAAAKTELIAAGVIKEGEDIPQLVLDMPGTDENSRRTGEFVKRQFGRVGLDLKVVMNDWPTLQKKVHSKVVQMYAMGWHADYPDAENFLQLYYSPNIKRGTNNSNYRNAEFDKLFKQAATIMDEQQRISLYARMGKILNEDAPVLLLTEPIGYILLYEWVRNDKPHPIGYGFRKYIHIDAKLRREMGGR